MRTAKISRSLLTAMIGALAASTSMADINKLAVLRQTKFWNRSKGKGSNSKNYWAGVWNGKKHKQGERECARRLRQINAGIIPGHLVFKV